MIFKQQIGIIGMSVMGSNLALNIANKGYYVSIFNRSIKKTYDFFSKNLDKKLLPFYTLENFVFSLMKPRLVILMIKAGSSIDNIIESLIPIMDKKDVIIDCGNSFYKDTIKRNLYLFKYGIYFIGAGISGGEEGALKGASIMIGGHQEAYKLIKPIFIKIAANNIDKTSCISYIGSDGSGHYVKMIHNSIEYGDMQLIAETYMLLKNFLNLNNNQIAIIFNKWNKGELNSYLINITKNILIKKDIDGNFLLDKIIDIALSKGTGKWASQDALDLFEPLTIVTESVFFRYLSSLKNQRIKASKLLIGPKIKPLLNGITKVIEKIRRALYFGKIISHIQGFSQLKTASKKNKWHLNYIKIAKIFRAGCIIQSALLQKIVDVYVTNPNNDNLLLTKYFKNILNSYQTEIRDVVKYAIEQGLPIPAFSSAISYYDSYRTILLPANLIQAQRDYFGSHQYQRTDKDGLFHTNWN